MPCSENELLGCRLGSAADGVIACSDKAVASIQSVCLTPSTSKARNLSASPSVRSSFAPNRAGNVRSALDNSLSCSDFHSASVQPDGRKPGRLDANDPITGQRKWTYEMDVPGFACVLTTGGGLVFNGDPMGKLQAFDADTGKVLWSFNTGSGMRGGIVSYRSTASSTSWWRAVGAHTRRS